MIFGEGREGDETEERVSYVGDEGKLLEPDF